MEATLSSKSEHTAASRQANDDTSHASTDSLLAVDSEGVAFALARGVDGSDLRFGLDIDGVEDLTLGEVNLEKKVDARLRGTSTAPGEVPEVGVQLPFLGVATGDPVPSVTETDKCTVLRASSTDSPSLYFRVLELLEPSRIRVDSKDGNCS